MMLKNVSIIYIYISMSCHIVLFDYIVLYNIYIYMLAPPPQKKKKKLCFHIVMREIGQQKHVRAILSVENIPVMVRHRQELYLSRDG